MFSIALLALFLTHILATPVIEKRGSLPTIHAYGSKLFTEDGAQFYIKGIAYQLTDEDPLANTAQCQRDAALMKTLGTNSIRVYHVSADLDHDGCMNAFADAGIYAWIDLDTFNTAILQYGNHAMWNETMFHAYQAVMDAFIKYDNTAGFFVGNEMITTGPSSIAAPYVKAAAKDMKAYRDARGYRAVPIGYSAADIALFRPNLQNYLACGDDSAAAVDFYSLNAYEWCGDSSYQVSGYIFLEQNASHYNLPIFFSETGCNVPEPRNFADQSAIFGPQMENTWSGAIIYEWVQAVNNYGLISYGPSVAPTATGSAIANGESVAGTPTPLQPDFDNLSTEWATLHPTGVSSQDYKPTATPPPCPSFTSGAWEISGNVPLPTLGDVGHYPTASASATKKKSKAVKNGGAAPSLGVQVLRYLGAVAVCVFVL